MNFSKLLAAGKSLIGVTHAHTPYRMRTPNFPPKFDSPKNPFQQAPKSEATLAKKDAPVSQAAPQSFINPAPVKSTPPALMETKSLFDASPQIAALPIPVSESAPATAEAVAIKFESKPVIAPEVPVVIVITGPATKPAPKKSTSRPIPVTSPLAAPPLTLPPVKPSPQRPATPAAKPSHLSDFVKKVNPLLYLTGHGAKHSSAKLRTPREPVQTELSLENLKVVRNDLSDTDLEVVPAKSLAKSSQSEVSATKPTLQTPRGTEETTLSRLTSRFFGQGQEQPTQVR